MPVSRARFRPDHERFRELRANILGTHIIHGRVEGGRQTPTPAPHMRDPDAISRATLCAIPYLNLFYL